MSRMTAVVCTVIIVVIGLLGSLVGGWHPAYVTLTIVLPMAFVIWMMHRKENAQNELVVAAPVQEAPVTQPLDLGPKDPLGPLMKDVFLPKAHPDFPNYPVIEDDAHLKKLNHYLISKGMFDPPFPFVLTSRREGPEKFPAVLAYLVPGPKFQIRFEGDAITCYKISDARSHAAKLKAKEVAVV